MREERIGGTLKYKECDERSATLLERGPVEGGGISFDHKLLTSPANNYISRTLERRLERKDRRESLLGKKRHPAG